MILKRTASGKKQRASENVVPVRLILNGLPPPRTPDPDWRKVDNYPDPRGTSLDRWAWEFLVRNESFIKAVKGLAALKGPGADLESPRLKRWSEILIEFGISFVREPGPFFDSPVKFASAPYRISAATLLSEEWGTALLFDRRQSIPKQLAAAEAVLRFGVAQDKAAGRKLQPRTQRNRHPDYRAMLRILDGLEAGAGVAAIAKELFPDHKGGKEGARDLVKVLRAEAQRLRDGGYRYLGILRAPDKLSAGMRAYMATSLEFLQRSQGK